VRRPLLALALVAAAVATAAQHGSTAGNAMPSTSTAAYRSTTVSGATLVSMEYVMTGSTITGVTARLRGIDLLTKTVTARFGDDSAVVCAAGVLTVLDTITGLGEADYTCTGFTERADRPRGMTVTAS
jgi:hypothetical protein